MPSGPGRCGSIHQPRLGSKAPLAAAVARLNGYCWKIPRANLAIPWDGCCAQLPQHVVGCMLRSAKIQHLRLMMANSFYG